MVTELKHLLLATVEDPYSMKSWSGIPYSLRMALERKVERVTVFQPPKPKRAPLDLVKRVMFGAENYPLWITKATLKQNARALAAEIERSKPDAVLSISSQCVAYLEQFGEKRRVPAVMFSDAPYQAFAKTYAEWDKAPKRIGRFAEEEARAARRMDGLCFGSEWACAEAKRLYKLESAEKLHVTPLGANWVPKLGSDEIFARIEERIARLETGAVDLLFLGRDWERKGGPLAVDIARGMRMAGLKVRLHVVGCSPKLGPAEGPDGFVTVHGPLYQTDPAQSARLAELFLGAHFMVVPTRAECFGIGFAEAQAFGLPAVSRRVQALPTVVRDGETGFLLEPKARAEKYVARMEPLVRDSDAYRSMARRSREWFEERLTWDRTAEAIVQVFQQRLGA